MLAGPSLQGALRLQADPPASRALLFGTRQGGSSRVFTRWVAGRTGDAEGKGGAIHRLRLNPGRAARRLSPGAAHLALCASESCSAPVGDARHSVSQHMQSAAGTASVTITVTPPHGNGAHRCAAPAFVSGRRLDPSSPATPQNCNRTIYMQWHFRDS